MVLPEDGSASVPAVAYRSPTLIAFLLFSIIFGGLFSYEVHALFLRESGVPSAERGENPRLIGPLAGQTSIAQTFGVEAGGLSAMTIQARPFGRSVAGDVVFVLREIGEVSPRSAAVVAPGKPAREVARVVVPAKRVVADGTFTIRFTPQQDSAGKQYQVELRAPSVAPADGIGVWATRDQAYLGGVLTVNGKEQWSDLAFETHATRATAFRRLEYSLRSMPAWVRSQWTLGAIFAIYNWALAAFTWYMLFVEDEPSEEPVSQ